MALFDKELYDMERSFSDIFDEDDEEEFFENAFDFPIGTTTGNNSNWIPDADMIRTKDEISIAMDLPGVKKEEIDVHLEEKGKKGKKLVVSGSRPCPDLKNKPTKPNYMMERACGDFYRTFDLKSDVDGSKIVAQYTNGVLNIKVPRIQRPTQKIEVLTK